MSEEEFQSAIFDLCKLSNLHVYHVRRSDKGAVTSRGFPDLVIVGKRTIFAELKKQTGKATLAQQEWMAALRESGEEVHLWRPSDLPAIAKVLRGLALPSPHAPGSGAPHRSRSRRRA